MTSVHGSLITYVFSEILSYLLPLPARSLAPYTRWLSARAFMYWRFWGCQW